MANHRVCDMCGSSITDENPVVAKLYSAPIKAGETRQSHSGYTASMDVGKCCLVKLKGIGKWQKRKKQGRRLAA